MQTKTKWILGGIAVAAIIITAVFTTSSSLFQGKLGPLQDKCTLAQQLCESGNQRSCQLYAQQCQKTESRAKTVLPVTLKQTGRPAGPKSTKGVSRTLPAGSGSPRSADSEDRGAADAEEVAAGSEDADTHPAPEQTNAEEEAARTACLALDSNAAFNRGSFICEGLETVYVWSSGTSSYSPSPELTCQIIYGGNYSAGTERCEGGDVGAPRVWDGERFVVVNSVMACAALGGSSSGLEGFLNPGELACDTAEAVYLWSSATNSYSVSPELTCEVIYGGEYDGDLCRSSDGSVRRFDGERFVEATDGAADTPGAADPFMRYSFNASGMSQILTNGRNRIYALNVNGPDNFDSLSFVLDWNGEAGDTINRFILRRRYEVASGDDIIAVDSGIDAASNTDITGANNSLHETIRINFRNTQVVPADITNLYYLEADFSGVSVGNSITVDKIPSVWPFTLAF